MGRIDYVCSTCGSRDIRNEGVAHWDVETQIWSFRDFDLSCTACDAGDDNIKEIDLKELAETDVVLGATLRHIKRGSTYAVVELLEDAVPPGIPDDFVLPGVFTMEGAIYTKVMIQRSTTTEPVTSWVIYRSLDGEMKGRFFMRPLHEFPGRFEVMT